ncbi:Asp23/Gls24 family envelope stress response protein [Antrihabitans cavernicola]|uniref:Asp23/Gls24 family envelope stress response protein n=1 Tax=Antrihabitans cavernicola TaxID=2495913 RepID=A0A5A7S365_9NOCA|nr:Asp23/Gls24 family envelope stress response protein [Spelaeibacter cavernicola]KAA0018946.1 Asp23/Gls24 family envelope stress response protein [Spelaeibacter cavernicola]
MADADIAAPQLDSQDPGLRGTLTIKNKVATRIAEHAALDVPEVIKHSSRLGALTGRELPRAVVDMTPVHPNVHVDIAVAWPSPVAAVCRQVRTRVADELDRLTGRKPSRVDVSVTEVVANQEEGESA